jgi:hypothetical protein
MFLIAANLSSPLMAYLAWVFGKKKRSKVSYVEFIDTEGEM